MKKIRFIQLILLVVAYALVAATSVVAKDRVERSFKWSGQMVLEFDLTTPTFPVVSWRIHEESGNGTHVGKYSCQASGSANLITGAYAGDGTLFAANGDMLFFHVNQEAEATCYTLTIMDGTGRFTGATGLWTGSATVIDRVQVGASLFVYSVNEGAGTITY